MIHKTYLTVRSYELDSYNHVNNAVYQNYLEHARMQFLNDNGFEYTKLIEMGFFIYVTHVDIKYKASARLNDNLIVETQSVMLKTVHGQFKQVIKKEDGTVCTEAYVDWACVTHDGHPAKIPDGFMIEALVPEEVPKK